MSANAELLTALEKLGPHDHLCSIYETPEEHFAVAVPFIRIGLDRHEQCIYIADDGTVPEVLERLRQGGIDVDAATGAGALTVTTKEHAYLKQGHFDPDWMFNFWKEAAERAAAQGFTSLRATGETEWVIRGAPGLERWMEYESRLTRTLADSNAFALCQYNRKALPPSVILDVIRTHPMVICGDTVCRNFYFVPAEEFLRPDQSDQEVSRLLHNIREREQMDQRLRRYHQGLEAVVRQRTAELERTRTERDRFFSVSRDLFVVGDLGGRITAVNPAWEQALGYPAAEMLGRTVFEFLHPEDRNAMLAELARLASGEETTHFENRFRAAGGAWHWLSWTANGLPEEGRLYGAARDITALKQAQEALRDREERFRRLFEDGPVGIVLASLEHRMLRANRAFCDMLGYSEPELVRKSFDDITHPDDIARNAELRARLVSGDIPSFRMEKRYLRKDGQPVWAGLTSAVVRDECGAPLYFLSTVENVGERREREEQIHRLNAELEQKLAELSAVNQELEAFTYSVSHDLRAPLRHVEGFSQILRDELGAEIAPPVAAALERIADGVQQMGRMVEDLLTLSRTGKRDLRRQTTGLGSLVKAVLADLGPELAGRDIRVDVAALPFVDCDPELTRDVLVNLLSNAIKFTRTRHPAIIEVGQTERDGETVLFVRDNGVGFSMKYAARLFGVFQRLHRREDFEGTGVGLAIVQRIVHKHGGRIWAEAELNKGAAFFFTLAPRETTDASACEAHA